MSKKHHGLQDKYPPNNRISRLATARFISYTLLAKLVLVGVCRADPQAADAEALARLSEGE